MNLQLTLAARYLSGRKLRTTLTTLAVFFGVLVIFGMNILIPSMLQSFQTNLMAASGKVDLTVTHKTGNSFDASLVNTVKAVPGIQAITPSLNRTVNLPANYFDHDATKNDAISTLSLVGIDPETAQTIHSYLINSGRFLQASDLNAAVITTSLADTLGVKLGGAFNLPTTGGEVTLTVVGLLPRRALPGNEEVLVSLAAAQAFTELPGQINTIEANFNTLDETARAKIESNVEQALGDNYHLGALPSGTDMVASLRTGQAGLNALGFLALFMGGFIIFNTFRTVIAERRRDIGMLRAVGASRRTITGIFLAESLIQGVLGTALGLLAGYLLGAGSLSLIAPIMSEFVHLQVGTPVVSLGLVITSIVLGIGVTVLAGLIPAVQASRVTPVEALRASTAEAHFNRNAGIGFILGVALIAFGVFALFFGQIGMISIGGLAFLVGLVLVAPAVVRPIANLFGRLIMLVFARQGTGMLAEGNLNRQPSRAAVTASTTMIGLAIIVAAGGMTTSLTTGFLGALKKSLGSDYLLVPPAIAMWGTNVGAGADLANSLRQVDGVDSVSTLRFALTSIKAPNSLMAAKLKSSGAASTGDDLSVSLIGIDPVVFPKVSGLTFSKGNENTAYQQLASGRTAILNGVLASALGAGPGDSLELLTSQGRQTYQVVAVATDYMDAKIQTAFISQANLKADFNREDDVYLQVNLKPNVTRSTEIDAQIRQVTAAYPQFQLVAGKDYYEENVRLFNAVFIGLYVMLGLLASPSLIAMTNTLAIAVIERTREIGMLRAIGTTRAQVRQMVMVEALLLAAIGTAFGLLGGLYMGYMMVSAMAMAGYPLTYVFPAGGLVAGIAIGLLFGVIAALIPARQAAGMKIVEALRYE